MTRAPGRDDAHAVGSAVVTDLHTARLRLDPIATAEGERIVARRPDPGDSWADDYPFPGDVMGVSAFLRASAAHGDQQPFGHYRITRRHDGMTIGGIGFKGRPAEGCVEIGYGLAPSARGQGLAAEALTVLLRVATANGLSRVVASTTADNPASQRTLERAGFTLVDRAGALLHYEKLVSP